MHIRNQGFWYFIALASVLIGTSLSLHLSVRAEEPILPPLAAFSLDVEEPASKSPSQQLKLKPQLEMELGSLELETLDGAKVNPQSMAEKKVVLYFWSIYCHGCSSVTKELLAIRDEFERANIAFVPIHLFESRPEKLRGELSRLGLSLPILLAPPGVRELFSIRLLPAVLVFDGSHRLSARFDGLLNSEGLKIELFSKVEVSLEN